MNSASIQRLDRFEVANRFIASGLDFTPVIFNYPVKLPKYESTTSSSSSSSQNITVSSLTLPEKMKPREDPQMRRYLPRSSSRRRQLEAQLVTSSMDILAAESTTNILSSNDIHTTIRTKEDLVCILRGTELEKFEISGLVQIQSGLVVLSNDNNNDDDRDNINNNNNNKFDKIVCDLKMSGIPNSVERLEVNRKCQAGPLSSQFAPGSENEHIARVSLSLSDQFSSALRYSISPAFKLMIAKVAVAIKVVTPPIGASGVSRSYLRVQVQLKINPNFRDQLEDISVMASIKKLLVYKVTNVTVEDVILDIGTTTTATTTTTTTTTTPITPPLVEEEEEKYVTAHLENFKVIPRGTCNRREAVISWTTASGSAASGSSNDFEAALDLRAAHDYSVSLSVEELEEIVRRSPSLPVIVKAKYKTNLISKTRFSLAALLHGGRTLEPSDVSELRQSELLSSTIEYRFLE